MPADKPPLAARHDNAPLSNIRTLGRRRKLTEVGAVHLDHAEAVFAHLGIGDALAAGELFCHQCSTPLTAESLAAARTIDGALAVCCRSAHCLEAFNEC